MEKSLREISFDTSTFYVQVHGFPPVYLHEKSATSIGNKICEVHHNTINRRCIVVQRYLRFRVDILIKSPIPAWYFMMRNNGNDLWIQFKFERLLDFCYRCGLLTHVIGRCNNKVPTLVTTPNGISAKLFGPWIRAENGGTLEFINMSETDD